MMAGTASLRSRLLGRIAGLHVLGSASIAASKDERHFGTEIGHVNNECDQLRKEIEDMPDVAALETHVKTLKQQLEDAKALNGKVEYLQKILGDLNAIKVAGKQLAQEVQALPQLDIDFSLMHTQAAQIAKLSQYNTALQSINTQLNTLIIPAEINVDFTAPTDLIKRIESLQKMYAQLTTIDRDIAGIDLSKYDIKVYEAEDTWQKELKALGICPTCKQPIAQGHVHVEIEDKGV
jgi:DNA repair exonuclease SbcCD ATPase subunit